jgi:hypothetical protein
MAAGASLGAPSDDSGPVLFVRQLYSHYPARDLQHEFYPAGPHAAQVFDQGLVALIRAVQKRSAGEEPPYLDSDLLCDCQDDGGLRVRIKSVSVNGSSAAAALVDLRFPGGQNDEELHLTLIRSTQGWRIDDIVSRQGSLRSNLSGVLTERR